MKRTLLTLVATGALAGAAMVIAADNSDQDSPPPPPKLEKGDRPGGPGGPGGKGPRDFRGHDGDRGPGGFGDREGGPGFRLAGALDLTKEQREKLKTILDGQKDKIKAIREEARQKMDAVMADIETQLRPSLTTEQQKVLDDLKALEKSREALKDKQQDQKPAAKPE